MKKFDVIVIGELNVDLILNNIAEFPRMNTEILARDMQLLMGSSSAIFASNLSILGARVAFLGKIGNDDFGSLVTDTLEQSGVSTEFIIRSSEYKTGATIVLNYGEDRAMLTHPGAMEQLIFDDITTEIIQHCRHIHISSVFLQTGILNRIPEILRQAKELDISTSLDPQWDPSEKWDLNLKELLPLIDVFLPNTQEFLALTGQKDVHNALDSVKDYAHTIAVKMGNKGSIGCINGQILKKKPFLNDSVVDTIGAGDSFNAGFIYNFLQKKDLDECLELGNLTGAINTTSAGGTTSFENIEKVKETAMEQFDYRME
ncbi:MAG TPA: carbohydrate kinase family protein [Bacteroides sp.]|nr:carbohydrate kinase family protein [Bacteroides sp.]